MNDSHRQSPVSASLHGLDSFCKKRLKEALVQFEFVNERITAETQRSPRLRRERRLGPSDPYARDQSTGWCPSLRRRYRTVSGSERVDGCSQRNTRSLL